MESTQSDIKASGFTRYQAIVIAILAILQFTIILDFMVLSPLGERLLEELHITTSQFGLVVSAYAFSAGASGLLAAGFADKFDRKKLLLFFYTGFIIGTILCAIAPTYNLLLIARIITGIFGGVISSVSFAIISDLFRLDQRGRVMGYVQSAFAASQILGLPVGLLLSNYFGWHAPFWLIAGFGVLLGIFMGVYLKPITAHLTLKSDRNPFQHMMKVISNSFYLRAFLATTFLATGGFMMMPFGAAFSVNNMGISRAQLPILYGVTGVFSILFGPLIGKLSDRLGKFKVFVVGSVISMIMVAVYTNLGLTPLWIVIAVNVVLFVGISSRMISASALMTAIPEPQDRGAFMSINSSVQQISGGIASAVAGSIVVQQSSGKLAHYDTLGYVVIAFMILVIWLVYIINAHIEKKLENSDPV
ncbi:MAG: MFS transporter [Pyrinomonadaceae bacterium]|nr:MFS transporter [Sphingobacteriaceae bacterium]